MVEVKEKEIEYFNNCELLNDLVIVKPQPVVASKIITVKANQKNGFRNKGVVMAIDKNADTKIKVGDVVVWSIFNVVHECYVQELVDPNDDFSGKYMGMSTKNIWYIENNSDEKKEKQNKG